MSCLHRILSIAIVVSFSAAHARDLAPPTWRGEPDTTFQHWTFSTPATSDVAPDAGVDNQFGEPELDVQALPGVAEWVPEFGGGLETLWRLTHGTDGIGRDIRPFLDFSRDELTDPLQQLNLATRCNLVVVVAACTGFAGVQALRRGPRAPAVALVGPDAPLMPRNLLEGTKEFYRRWLDEDPRLAGIAASASHQAGTVAFECEPFAILAYEALVESLIKSIRPAERLRRTESPRQRMLAETGLSASEIEDRLGLLPPWEVVQQMWDQMFMIDLYPSNRERFSLDLRTIVECITASSIS
jgi:hypothetical protein